MDEEGYLLSKQYALSYIILYATLQLCCAALGFVMRCAVMSCTVCFVSRVATCYAFYYASRGFKSVVAHWLLRFKVNDKLLVKLCLKVLSLQSTPCLLNLGMVEYFGVRQHDYRLCK